MEYHESMYGNLIAKSIQKVYEKGISNRILEHMRRIRNSSDINQARRWPMELLQNAQDLSWDNRPVHIRITEGEDSLRYEHTGKPFRVSDILAIINQVSSKTPGESVGQFGTGFMTTYQMSEKVELESFLKEDGMPYQKFHITLDRSGHTQEELHEALEKNMNELMILNTLDTISEEDYDKDSYHTSFTYHLSDEHSREVAETGVRDLKNTILFVLLFASGIGSIELDLKDGSRVIYERGETRTVASGFPDDPPLYETEILESGKPHHIRHISMENAADTGNRLTIALEYDPEKGYIKIGEQTARVFVDFPLVGAEDFPFPMVVNCRAFRPNEPRSTITLVDLERSEDAVVNKALMDAAVRIYSCFLDHVCGEGHGTAIPGIENVIRIPEYHEKPDWSETWVSGHIYDALYNTICIRPIIMTTDGMKSLSCDTLRLIKADSADERADLIRLCENVKSLTVPSDDTDWYAAMSSFRQIQDCHIDLESLLKSASLLTEKHDIEGNEISWYQQLFDVCMKYEKTSNLIRTGMVAVFPNQNFEKDDHLLYRATELFRDPDIPDVLKDVTEELDNLVAGSTTAAINPLRIRSRLLHSDFHVTDFEQMQLYPVSDLVNYIITRSRREYPVKNYNDNRNTYQLSWKHSWFKMLSCCPDKDMYQLCSEIYPDHVYEYDLLEDDRFTRDLWRPSMRGLMNLIIGSLAGLKTMNALAENGLDTDWLNRLFRIAPNYLGSYDSPLLHYIFPDQHGNLVSGTVLRQDMIEAEELKDIADSLSSEDSLCDIRSRLLDKRISLDQRWNMSTMDDLEVSNRISKCIQRILSNGNLNNAPDNVQNACTALLAWLQENPEKASRLFPDFSTEEQQARLVTANGVVNLQKRSRTLDRLMEMTGAGDTDDLMDCIEDYMQNVRRQSNSAEGDYDAENGVFFGSELQYLSARERDEFLRMVGNAGEIYAFEHERQKYLDDGWELISEDEHRYSFSKDGQKAEIYRPDSEKHHQKGWDIRISEWDQENDSQNPDREQLIEVKTHTTSSVMYGLIPLSRTQMRLALSHGTSYAVYVVDYDTKQNCAIGLSEYPDISREIADGKVSLTEDRYLLKIAG